MVYLINQGPPGGGTFFNSNSSTFITIWTYTINYFSIYSVIFSYNIN